MAQPPLTYLEKKWAFGVGGGNSLIKAATQNSDRQNLSMMDYDTHKNVSNYGRRVLMTIGRFLYWNCAPIRASVDEISRLSVSSFIPQFYGEDREWGKAAEEFLYESDKFIDVRGWPYNWSHYLQNLVREVLVDGDQGTLLTELDNSAKVQVWRSHRINSQQGNGIVQGGAYDGATIIDGVVMSDIGRPIAYALQDSVWGTPFAYVPTKDFLLNFLPTSSDSIRGYSSIATAAFPMLDREESKNFLLIGQKLAATYPIAVHNESGMADRAKQLLSAPATAASDAGDAQSLPTELRKPGSITYFRAGTNQKIEVLDQNQPGENVINFQEEIIRESLQSMGWSFDFSHNPTKAGGAQMRIVIEKVEARLNEIRTMLVEPAARRITGYRISKAINSGLLKDSSEWFKWTFQGPAKLTADRKYDSEIDLEETARGLMTDAKACARRGDYYEETYDQKERETFLKLEAAKRLKQSAGEEITIQEAYDMLWKPNPNAPAPKKEEKPKAAVAAE